MRLSRASVLEKVVEKLAQISKENGYSCDMGLRVENEEGMEPEPKNDCVAVIGGDEVFGAKTRPGVYPRTLTVYLSSMFYENDPLGRAKLATEDILVWLDKNPSLGVTGMRLEMVRFKTELDSHAQLAELLTELRIHYQ